MRHHGYMKLELFEMQGTTKVIKFTRNAPTGHVDSEEDPTVEILGRGKEMDALRSPFTRAASQAQKTPTVQRGVSAYFETDDSGIDRLRLKILFEGSQSTELTFATLDPDRDKPEEWDLRGAACTGCRSQLSEFLALAAANPTLQIGAGLMWVTDK